VELEHLLGGIVVDALSLATVAGRRPLTTEVNRGIPESGVERLEQNRRGLYTSALTVLDLNDPHD
jgi:hypothetical protein